MKSATKQIWLALAVLGLGLCAGGRAEASIVTYVGNDNGANPGDPRPNSNAAAASFNTAASAVGSLSSTITFETATLGTFTTLNAGQGVTVNSVNNSEGVENGTSRITGYNTTAGGSKYLGVAATGNPGGYVFNFAAPIAAFGAYFTGVGTSNGTVSIGFSDGTSQSITVAGNANGGVEFLGFTDAGKLISSVSTEIRGGTGDIFGVDDVRFASVNAVPEPSTVALAMSTLPIGLAWLWKRRKGAKVVAA